MLPFCVAVALACDLPRSHADGRSVSAELLQHGLVRADEAIVGRARAGGRFLLLTSGGRLIGIDDRGAVSQRTVESGGEELWNLAVAEDGTLWALAGRDTLVEIPRGPAARRLALDGAYAGVHAGPGFLLYQPYDFRVGSPSLLRGEPALVGGPAGQLRVAGGEGPRVAVWMKSLVQCGFVAAGRVPCWPVGAVVVDVIDAVGAGLLVALRDLEPREETSGEEFAERGRPVLQDVALDAGQALWVLAADPGAPVVKERGVRDLWRFSLNGRRLERHRLSAPARMLIAAGRDRLFAVSGSGDLVRLEVK